MVLKIIRRNKSYLKKLWAILCPHLNNSSEFSPVGVFFCGSVNHCHKSVKNCFSN